MVKVKICGLSRECDVDFVNTAVPDYCGFVIHVPKSRRNVGVTELKSLRQKLRPEIIPVGVFVDAPVALVSGLINDGTIGAAQLHGHENETYIQILASQLTKRSDHQIIQAFKVGCVEDAMKAEKSLADLILLDGGAGDGQIFDWSYIKNIKRPFFLAGGLAPENLSAAILQTSPWGVDMSSGVETDGFKDKDKILRAVQAVREY